MFEKNWQELIKPTKIEIEKKESDYVKFSSEPFERGHGVTIGNSLRRIFYSQRS
jgi:DNA-directed RNA polymerase subunit alpha